MVFIGTDEASKLIKKAALEGYDALMIFEVEITLNRVVQKVINETRIRLVDPNLTPKEVREREAKDPSKKFPVSRSLKNIDVAKSRAKSEPDGLDEAVERFVKGTENAIGLQSFPTGLTPEIIVSKRIPAIVENSDTSVLDRLSEINLYYYKGFIDEKQKADAFEKIVGPSGNAIASGSGPERLAAVQKLVEKELK